VNSREVAAVLAEIAVLSELNGENAFRARAFAAAARNLEGTDANLRELAREGRLTSLPGIGAGIAETIRELVESGRSGLYEELRTATPIGLFEVMRVPGLGPKRVHTLYAELGIESLDALETAALDGRLAKAPGFGARTVGKVLDGIRFVREGMRRRRYPEAREVAERLRAWLRGRAEVRRAEVAGAIRRCLEVVDAVELVALTDDAPRLVAAFSELNGIALREESEGCAAGQLADGIAVRLHCTDAAGWAAAMLTATGSEAHLASLEVHAASVGLRLDRGRISRDGVPVEVADEAAAYAALGLPWIAPELREGLGEVGLAADGLLPRLVEASDLRGTFHCHTVFSDGRGTLEEMAEAAAARGWRYFGIADHSQSAAYAGGLPPDRVREQRAAVDAWNTREGGRLRLFHGVESDILADGSLDYDDDVLAGLDYVVGSVHSGFGLSEAQMTERVLRAVRNPYLTILGHPTGRLLLRRDGYPLDVPAVLDAAAEHGVVVEINANPHRLDLDWRHLRYAAERGVLIAINPDAHSVDALDDVEYGVNAARKGGLEARQILNTWTIEEVEAHLARRRSRIQEGA
jgi:DNA polymerase (family X)